jgi:hypothetical protein
MVTMRGIIAGFALAAMVSVGGAAIAVADQGPSTAGASVPSPVAGRGPVTLQSSTHVVADVGSTHADPFNPSSWSLLHVTWHWPTHVHF